MTPTLRPSDGTEHSAPADARAPSPPTTLETHKGGQAGTGLINKQ